jgi:CheY-like chemotaxis protein
MMVSSGSLKSVTLSDILAQAAAENFTGIVTIKGNSGLGSVTLRSGKVVDVREPRFRSRLGRALVQKKLITEKELQSALKEQKSRGKGPLGEILMGMGLVGRANLEAAIKEVLEESLVQLLTWKEGLFRADALEAVIGEDVGISPIADLARHARLIAPGLQEDWYLNEMLSQGGAQPAAPVQGEVLQTVKRLSSKLRELKPKEIVLLVEDEALMRHLFRDKLESFGFTVEAVDSPRAALDKLADYDTRGLLPVVVSDLIMPTLSGKGLFGGLELLEEIQKSFSLVPVLVTTSYPDPTVRRRALFLGATYYINKPDRKDITPEKLEGNLNLFIEELALCIQNIIQRHEVYFEREQQNILRQQLVGELMHSQEELARVGELASREAGDIRFLRETSDRMVKERSLGNIAEQILAFAATEFDRRAILLVRKDSVSGYYAADRRPGAVGFDERIKALSFPLAEAPLLAEAARDRKAISAVDPGVRVGDALFLALGEPPPAHAVILPMIVQNMTVALLYGDVAPGSPPPRDVDSLLILLNLASMSLEITQLQKMLVVRKA